MNAKKTKLNKNYVLLVTIIAALGVIFALFFALSSFAEVNDENLSVKVSGTCVDSKTKPVADADVEVVVGTYPDSKSFTGKTQANGYFEITVSSDKKTVPFTSMFISKAGGENSANMAYTTFTPEELVENKDFGQLSLWYASSIIHRINGERNVSNQYGAWSRVTVPGNDQESNGDDQVAITYKSCYASFTDNQVSLHYVSPSGYESTMIWTFTPNPGYELSNVDFYKTNFESNSNSPIDVSAYSLWAVDANVGFGKHTVTYDENIADVTAFDKHIDSGTKVDHGTVVYISPVAPDKGQIAKLTVNGKIIPYDFTVVNSDIEISANYVDSVKISGVVTADDSVVANGNKDFNNLFIQKAYAAQVGVEGATVTFESKDGWATSTLTDNQGAYELDVEKGMGGILTISKEGFNTYTKELSDEDLSNDVTVSSSLATEKANVAQTGDVIPCAVIMMVLLASGFVAYRVSRKSFGCHVR